MPLICRCDRTGRQAGSDSWQGQHRDRGKGGQAEGDRGSRDAHRAHLEALRDRDQEQDSREQHGVPQVALGGVARGGALVERRRGERVQPGRGREAWIAYGGMAPGPAGAAGLVNGSVFCQAKKGHPVVRCKTANVERLGLAVASGTGLQPRGEHGDVGGQFQLSAPRLRL